MTEEYNEENEITFQTFTDTFNTRHENTKIYTTQYHQLTQKIAQSLRTPHQNIRVNTADKIIIIHLEQDRLIYTTLTKLEQLAEYIGVDNLAIYTPSRNTIIINYNQEEEQEEITEYKTQKK